MNRTALVPRCVLVLLCCGVLACGVLACAGSKDSDPPPPPITYQQSPQPDAVKAAVREPTAAELPITEDFDEASEQEINADNFRAELDRVEVEINADNGD